MRISLLGLWEGLVEGRIRLQKLLPLCNRLPQGDTMAALVEVSEPPILQEQQTCEWFHTVPRCSTSDGSVI